MTAIFDSGLLDHRLEYYCHHSLHWLPPHCLTGFSSDRSINPIMDFPIHLLQMDHPSKTKPQSSAVILLSLCVPYITVCGRLYLSLPSLSSTHLCVLVWDVFYTYDFCLCAVLASSWEADEAVNASLWSRQK